MNQPFTNCTFHTIYDLSQLPLQFQCAYYAWKYSSRAALSAWCYASLQPTRGFTAGPLTSKLDWGLSADDRAVHVGSQTGVLPYMLGFGGVADDQVSSH